MRRPLAFAPLLLIAASTAWSGPTTRPAPALIEQLDDPDPLVRQHAAAELQRLGPDATPDLIEASRDTRPAVAEAAAGLLMKRDWSAPGDSPQVVRLLRRYGDLPSPDRAGPLSDMIKLGLPNYRAVVLRVLSQDPSDEVAWAVVTDVRVDGQWLAELRKLKGPLVRAPFMMLLARCTDFNGDHVGATALCRQVLDSERQRPTAPGRMLWWAVETVRLADLLAGRYAEAVDYLHDQFARADDQTTSQPELIGELLELHTRGPFPGFAADLRAANADDGQSGLAMGVIAARCGLPFAGRLLTDAATADKPDETDTDRADRYAAATDFLMHVNRLTDAEAVLNRLVAINGPAARLKLPGGYTRLSDLYARRKQFQEAGDALQRALDRQTGLQMVGGNGVAWPLADEQAQVYLYYCQAAQARGDTADAAEQARRIVASGSADSRIFLDVFPTAEAAVSRAEMDAYFDRVYALARSNTDFVRESPTELNDLAWLCARAGRRLDEARQLSERSNALSPDQSAFLDTLAEIRFRQNDPAAAVALEERALAHQPDDEDFMRTQLDRFRAAAATRPATQPAPTH